MIAALKQFIIEPMESNPITPWSLVQQKSLQPPTLAAPCITHPKFSVSSEDYQEATLPFLSGF
jgi:hypothetical protein